MRKGLLIVLWMTMLVLTGCQHHTSYPAQLLLADSLAGADPTTAMTLLSTMEEDMSKAPKTTQMLYRLLCIKAADKAYIPHTSDSLILPVVEYYEQGGDPDYLGEAYYYAGRVYRDLNDVPLALTYFQKGLDASRQSKGRWVSAVLYAQMGEIYYYQSLYPEALEMYGEAFRIDSIASDTLGIILDLRDLAFTHRTMQQPDSALHYLHQAELLAQQYGDEEMQGLIASQLAGLYNQQGNTEMAHRFIDQALKQVGEADKFSTYDVYANILLNENRYEEAKTYYLQMLQADAAPVRQDAYNGLATIAAHQHQANDYLYYYELYKACTDSIHRADATESVSRMNAMYNYQLREKENIRLQKQLEKHQQLMQRIAFVVSIILLLLIIYYQYNRRKRMRHQHNKERLQQLKEEKYRQSEAFIQANKEEIIRLQQQLAEANQENHELVERLERQKEQLENANLVAEIKRGERKQADSVIKDSAIMKHLQQSVVKGNHIKPKDIKEIEQLLDEAFPDFRQHLSQLGTMNPLEYQVCLMLKMELSPTSIATLVLRDKSTVSLIRRRLLKKVTGRDGAPTEWDSIILSL